MRMRDLAGKEIVNILNGAKLGIVGDSDMTIDVESGEILSIILPQKNNFINLWMDRHQLVIPWEAVKKIGAEVIIVELDQTSPYYRRCLM
ncbi:MAG: YlmC/YmxH family sporulation protein [Desulfotomaculaceae bacterium]|nr:YlmC/YmxH family sporulation protein [Desulfotomaculaceae bacterium]